MKTPTTRFLLSLTTAMLGLGACQDAAQPIDEKALTQRMALYAEATIHEAGPAMSFAMADEGTVKKIMGSTSSAGSSVAPAMLAVLPPTAMLRAMVGPRVTNQMVGFAAAPSMLTTEEQFDEAGKEIRRMMQERLFVDANFESKTNDTATYLLHADPTCRPLTQDTDPVGFVPEIDASCADDFAKVAVRLAVRADGDGGRLTILIGPGRLELAAFIVHSDEIAVEVDLPKAKTAADYIQQQIPDGNPIGEFDRLAGKLRGSLKKVGSQKVTVALAILEPLDIAPKGDLELKSAATNPLIALTSSGITQTAQVQIGLGATDVGTTWDPQNMGLSNRDLHVVIGGLYGQLALDEGQKQILLTDVGIAQSKVTVRGATIVDLNLNADTMRRFSGKVTSNVDGTARLEITPKFDLSLGFDFNAVVADFTSPPDAIFAHETYGVTLANAGAATIIEEVVSSATFGGGIRIVAGTLTLAAASVPAETLTVPAGKCLTSQSPVAAGAHPILGALIVADCP